MIYSTLNHNGMVRSRKKNYANHTESANSFLNIITIPPKIIITPMYSLCETYAEVPTINRPAITPTTTDTLIICCTFTKTSKVTNIKAPDRIITAHCHKEGTTRLLAGKKMGKPMLQAKRN